MNHLPKTLVVKSRNKDGFRKIPPYKWIINRNTPPGDDADVYELKPHGGRKYIPFSDIIRFETSDTQANH